jgi:hypothetical protein
MEPLKMKNLKNLPAKIYVMVDPDKKEGCKVGVSNDPARRLKTYRTSAPGAKMLKVWDVPSRDHERAIIDLLKDVFRVRSEWVYGNPGLVANIIDGYMADHLPDQTTNHSHGPNDEHHAEKCSELDQALRIENIHLHGPSFC